MENKAVSDTGPIIHLSEINFVNSLDIFSKILIPEEVSNELRLSKISIPKNIDIVLLKPESKDKVKIFTNQHNLDIGEAGAISLVLQEKADYFLTDDLDARVVAENYNIESHGSLGIILRAFKDKIINKKIVLEKINQLHTVSSLFITTDLIQQAINAVNNYK